jgi:hypothetical protein
METGLTVCCAHAGRARSVKHFVPSSVPAEGLGVLSLFQLVDAAVPS